MSRPRKALYGGPDINTIREMELSLVLELISRMDGEWRDSFV